MSRVTKKCPVTFWLIFDARSFLCNYITNYTTQVSQSSLALNYISIVSHANEVTDNMVKAQIQARKDELTFFTKVLMNGELKTKELLSMNSSLKN